MSKPILFLALIHLLFINTTGAQINITISNPSSIDRKGELVSVDWKSIQAAYPTINTTNFKVINKATKKELAWQLERMGAMMLLICLCRLIFLQKESWRCNCKKANRLRFL